MVVSKETIKVMREKKKTKLIQNVILTIEFTQLVSSVSVVGFKYSLVCPSQNGSLHSTTQRTIIPSNLIMHHSQTEQTIETGCKVDTVVDCKVWSVK